MKINVDRMATLAGLGKASKSNSLNENMQYEEDMTSEFDGGIGMDEIDNTGDLDEVDDDMDELIEVDEVELVQELRRAKKVMMETKRLNQKQNLQEQNLKKIIE